MHFRISQNQMFPKSACDIVLQCRICNRCHEVNNEFSQAGVISLVFLRSGQLWECDAKKSYQQNSVKHIFHNNELDA